MQNVSKLFKKQNNIKTRNHKNTLPILFGDNNR